MYQGRNRTALASQRQIAKAMLELMSEEPYAGITVAEVCRRADLRALCRAYSRFVIQHRKVLQLLADNDLVGLLQERYYAFLTSCWDFRDELREEYRNYAAIFIAAGMTRLTEIYVRQDLDAQLLEDITYNLLCGNYRAG